MSPDLVQIERRLPVWSEDTMLCLVISPVRPRNPPSWYKYISERFLNQEISKQSRDRLIQPKNYIWLPVINAYRSDSRVSYTYELVEAKMPEDSVATAKENSKTATRASGTSSTYTEGH